MLQSCESCLGSVLTPACVIPLPHYLSIYLYIYLSIYIYIYIYIEREMHMCICIHKSLNLPVRLAADTAKDAVS